MTVADQKPKIQFDKVEHFGVAMIFTFGLYFVCGLGWAVVLGCLGWAVKELFLDAVLGMGVCDPWDYFWSLIGVFTGAIIILAVQQYQKWKEAP